MCASDQSVICKCVHNKICEKHSTPVFLKMSPPVLQPERFTNTVNIQYHTLHNNRHIWVFALCFLHYYAFRLFESFSSGKKEYSRDIIFEIVGYFRLGCSTIQHAVCMTVCVYVLLYVCVVFVVRS